MSTAPSLALRSLLTGVLRETGFLSPLQRISGATSPVRAMAVAAAAKRLSDTTILLVVPTDAEIDALCGDISFFVSVLEGSAPAVVERQVLPFPSTQVDPYRGFQPHLKVASARARVLHALATNTARVVVASAAALLTRLPEPAAILCHPARSSRASTSILMSSRTPWCWAATRLRIPWTPMVSSRAAAAFSTSSPRAKSCRSESSSSATPSNRSAASILEPSDRSRRWIVSGLFRSANCLRD